MRPWGRSDSTSSSLKLTVDLSMMMAMAMMMCYKDDTVDADVDALEEDAVIMIL